MKLEPAFPVLGLGLGLRTPFYSQVLAASSQEATRDSPTDFDPATTPIQWFEFISENLMGTRGGRGGRPLRIIETLRRDWPFAFHGVSLSIGSTDPLNLSYLHKLKDLVHRFEPAIVSDHLCWTGQAGLNLHDLLPIPYTDEALAHISSRIHYVQDLLGRRLLIENVSSYLSFSHSTWQECEFLAELTRRTDCGLLLDINNVFVSSVNHGFDPREFLNRIPLGSVGQFHIAGHQRLPTHIVDTHDHPVCEDVWQLYGYALQRFGPVSTLLERDDNMPPLSELEAELRIAKGWQERIIHGQQTYNGSIGRTKSQAAAGFHAETSA